MPSRRRAAVRALAPAVPAVSQVELPATVSVGPSSSPTFQTDATASRDAADDNCSSERNTHKAMGADGPPRQGATTDRNAADAVGGHARPTGGRRTAPLCSGVWRRADTRPKPKCWVCRCRRSTRVSHRATRREMARLKAELAAIQADRVEL